MPPFSLARQGKAGDFVAVPASITGSLQQLRPTRDAVAVVSGS